MCKFCEPVMPGEQETDVGEFRSADGTIGGGYTPTSASLCAMVGEKPDDYGIQFCKYFGVPYLLADNSCGEYKKIAVRISYCPMCGKRLKSEMEARD